MRYIPPSAMPNVIHALNIAESSIRGIWLTTGMLPLLAMAAPSEAEEHPPPTTPTIDLASSSALRSSIALVLLHCVNILVDCM